MDTLVEARKAVRDGDVDTLQTLLSKEPDLVHQTEEDNKRTLLHTLADFPSHTPRQADIARVLIDGGRM